MTDPVWSQLPPGLQHLRIHQLEAHDWHNPPGDEDDLYDFHNPAGLQHISLKSTDVNGHACLIHVWTLAEVIDAAPNLRELTLEMARAAVRAQDPFGEVRVWCACDSQCDRDAVADLNQALQAGLLVASHVK